MIKNLKFEPAQPGKLSLVPRKISHAYEDNQGKLRRIADIVEGGYNSVPDKSDHSKMTVYREDLPLMVSGLNWISAANGGCDFSTTKFITDNRTGQTRVVNYETDLVEIEVPGIFTPSPSPEEIHEVVETYKLLNSRYPVFLDIFRVRDEMLEEMLAFLWSSQRKTFEVLMKAADRKTRKSLVEVAEELPPQLARVMELRKKWKTKK